MKERTRIAIFLSGSGTTAEKIIHACNSGRVPGEIVLVISNTKETDGLERVRKAGVARENTLVLQQNQYTGHEAFGEEIQKQCRRRGVKVICQYGWTILTPANVVAAFEGKILNQHPGPLDPGFLDFGGKGMRGRAVHASVLRFFSKVERKPEERCTEATTHLVQEKYDTGDLLLKRAVPLLPKDTPEILSARVLPVEYEVQIESLEGFLSGSLVPHKREERLVRPGEEHILERAKEYGISLYPNG